MKDKRGSHRAKKRMVQDGIERLKSIPGWDPAKFVSTSTLVRLKEVQHEYQTRNTFEAAQHCQQCHQLRQASGDPTALCEEHFAQAMSFG
jgi:hypothetical protein